MSIEQREIIVMKAILALLMAVLLGAGATACGSSTNTSTTSRVTQQQPSHRTASASTTVAAPPGGYLKNDNDTDPDDKPRNRGNPEEPGDESNLVAPFGHRKANAADTSAITTLVKSYFAASAAENGARACSLLATHLADGLGANGGGQACAAAMSPLLRQQHTRLAADDVSTMVVTSVHAKGNLGVAILGFRATPEGSILVEREGHTWKIDALFASGMS
jgi:hypothetical protein